MKDDVRELVSAARQLIAFEDETRTSIERGEYLSTERARRIKDRSIELFKALGQATDRVSRHI